MARNDLRARGAWGGREEPHQIGVGVARSATPTASKYINIKYIKYIILNISI